MSDDSLLERVSAHVDGELDTVEAARLDADLAEAPDARAFLERIEGLRRRYRYAAADEPPDVAARVIARITPPTRPSWQMAAAVFVSGAIAGAAFVGFATNRGPEVSAATVPDRIVAAQRLVSALEATVEVTEHGWHPLVATRRYNGSIRYEAPEQLSVELDDVTQYPGPGWVRNDVTIVVDAGSAWSTAPAACPREALPGCTPPEPRTWIGTGLEPFPEAVVLPLDLVVPVSSFAGGPQPDLLGQQEVVGRPAIGVRVTVAQVDPLLSGFLSAGNWRLIHPTDEVELWLDESSLVPLSVTVRAAGGEDRALWAVRRGYRESAGDVLLTVVWSDVDVNPASLAPLPQRPKGSAADAGFADAVLDGLRPRYLPPGMEPHREGTSGARNVRSWSDGRAWVKVGWSTSWEGDRLFGDLGLPVRRVAVGEGVGYLDEAGTRLALRGNEVDVVVTGSVPTEELERIAAGLDVVGLPVPPGWPESGAAGVAEAQDAVPGLLMPTGDGFGPPAISVTERVVTIGYAGPGNRGFTVVESVADLAPPLDADVRGVAVRATVGRWSPDRGRLEWVEDGVAITVHSRSLGLADLLDVAASMDNP